MALERKHPGLPLAPRKVERREFEYKRYGTLSFTCNFDVASGELSACTADKTRNEKDFLEHINLFSATLKTGLALKIR